MPTGRDHLSSGPYDVRHLFATTLLNEGGDLSAVSKLMGHSSIQMTANNSRLLRNSRKSLLAPFFRVREAAVGADFSPGPGCFAPLAAFASQRGHVRSTGDLEDRLFQIEGHGIEQELQFDLGQTEVSGSKEAIATLEGAESTLHL